ncbi:MAG: hypothetical protein AAGK74_12205, partial [Chloroflexota bacterium]
MIQLSKVFEEKIFYACLIALLILAVLLHLVAVWQWGMNPWWLLLTVPLSLILLLPGGFALLVPVKPLVAFAISTYGYAPARRIKRTGAKNPDVAVRLMIARLRWMRSFTKPPGVNDTPFQEAIAAIGPEGFRVMIHILAENNRTRKRWSQSTGFGYRDVQRQLFMQKAAVFPVLLDEVTSDDPHAQDIASQLLSKAIELPDILPDTGTDTLIHMLERDLTQTMRESIVAALCKTPYIRDVPPVLLGNFRQVGAKTGEIMIKALLAPTENIPAVVSLMTADDLTDEQRSTVFGVMKADGDVNYHDYASYMRREARKDAAPGSSDGFTPGKPAFRSTYEQWREARIVAFRRELDNTTDPQVRAALHMALARIGDAEQATPLLEIAQNGLQHTRYNLSAEAFQSQRDAILAPGDMKDEANILPLVNLLLQPTTESHARKALQTTGRWAFVAQVLTLLNTNSEKARDALIAYRSYDRQVIQKLKNVAEQYTGEPSALAHLNEAIAYL